MGLHNPFPVFGSLFKLMSENIFPVCKDKTQMQIAQAWSDFREIPSPPSLKTDLVLTQNDFILEAFRKVCMWFMTQNGVQKCGGERGCKEYFSRYYYNHLPLLLLSALTFPTSFSSSISTQPPSLTMRNMSTPPLASAPIRVPENRSRLQTKNIIMSCQRKQWCLRLFQKQKQWNIFKDFFKKFLIAWVWVRVCAGEYL